MTTTSVNDAVITLPLGLQSSLSIRAKALLFHDPVSLHLQQKIERLAPTDASVLVIGETGTGKELVARHLHTYSRRSGPFLAVNCGAFTESLIDAELFGHETGAYTSAGQSRAGWFEAANKGTLFLDEIGDLSLPLQVKLLRVLQERQVVRLGSRRPIELDVRVVAATNIDLQKAVHAGNFRADLYYRLNVARIHVRPLRERPTDILPLAEHFIRLYAARMKRGDIFLHDDAKNALRQYHWPGNIRELENAIHCALIVSRGFAITAEDLQLDMLSDPKLGLNGESIFSSSPQFFAKTAPQGLEGHAAADWVDTPPVAPDVSSAASTLAQDTMPTMMDTVSVSGASSVGSSMGHPGMPLSEIREDIRVSQTESEGTRELAPRDRLLDALGELVQKGLSELPGEVWLQYEAKLVETAYEHSRRNQMQMARLLGISRNTVRTLLFRHGWLNEAGT